MSHNMEGKGSDSNPGTSSWLLQKGTIIFKDDLSSLKINRRV